MSSSPPRSSLSQIAALLNVSSATVSNALSGKGRVSAELTDKIRTTAATLGYSPGVAGRALRTGRSHVLGLVLPDIANPLFPQIAQAVEHAASGAGCGVLIADSRGNVAQQTEAVHRLIERGVDGIVIVPRRGTRITGVGKPVAVIDSPSTPGNTVSADHWQGGQLIMDHLAGLGHRKILMIANNPDSNVQNDRLGGMKSRLPPGATGEVVWVEKLEKQRGAGCALGLAQWFDRGFTAYATVSDLLALRALTELLGAGISIPDQVSVTGFDDLTWSTVVRPALSTVRMDMQRIATIAVDALIAAIEAGADTEAHHNGPIKLAAPAQEAVPMTLIRRQTTGRPVAYAGAANTFLTHPPQPNLKGNPT